VLVLCEKPSVAGDFADALGCEKRKGYYQNRDTVITYCVGHLFELCKPESYNPAYKTWDDDHLPIIPPVFRYERIPGVSFQTDTVLSLLKKHAQDEIVIATDAGREGELIARIALAESGIADFSRIKRFWVSEAHTPEVIQKGLREAKPLSFYDGISREGFARQRADWLVGINLTRYMTIRNKTLFSVGRVQTAVLNAIAMRNEETAHFVPVPFVELEAVLRSSNGTMIKAWLINPETEKTGFANDRDYVRDALEQCRIHDITHYQSRVTRETRRPEKLLDITGLQKAAYKRFAYTPEKTLELAQSLYEKYKCLSYPRTPSRVMGDQNVELFREKFKLLSKKYPVYARFADESLIRVENKNIFNSAALEDHHALIPLNVLPEDAALAERKVYEIVLASFFTVCMKDYIYNKKGLIFHVGNYMFRSQVNEVIQRGFKKSVVEKKEPDENVQDVEQFDEKTCKLIKTEILQKETRPKKEFSFDTLLGFMENPRDEEGVKLAGLGTPATRAAIIKTLFDREYLREEKKKLYATEKGLFLINQLKCHDELQKIADAAQTTEWEKQLRADPDGFEEAVVTWLRSCVQKTGKAVYRKEPIGVCPMCGKPVTEHAKSYCCTAYASNPPCHFAIWKEIAGAKISMRDAALLLASKPTPVKKCISKSGKQFSASLVIGADGKTAFTFQDTKKTGRVHKRQDGE
jgi:DNA topoisomerase-3